MAIDRTYRCDLCNTTLHPTMYPRPIGIYWLATGGIEERPYREVEHHLCVKCISGVQAMPKRCGQGYECSGGPKCGSDHK